MKIMYDLNSYNVRIVFLVRPPKKTCINCMPEMNGILRFLLQNVNLRGNNNNNKMT